MQFVEVAIVMEARIAQAVTLLGAIVQVKIEQGQKRHSKHFQ